jgi:hypothetical protein
MSVNVNVRFRPESVALLPRLTEEAIRDAIIEARAEIYEAARRYTPVDTGKLLASFDVAFTPRTIAMIWEAPYAKAADTGRPDWRPYKRGGYHFREAMQFDAPRILHDKLVQKLGEMAP